MKKGKDIMRFLNFSFLISLIILALFSSPAMAGVVTLHAAGPQSYYLGEAIPLYGDNTDSSSTYLFITGPNLPLNGAKISSSDPPSSPVIDGDPSTFFYRTRGEGGTTWEWGWSTQLINLDPGYYTIYAESAPRDLAHISSSPYAKITVLLKKPFVSATLSSSSVNPGVPLFVRGTAEGAPTPGIAIWIIGKNYIIRDTVLVEDDGSFEYQVETSYLSPGEYKVLLQHPMYNDQFDIVLNGNNVRNLKLGATGTDIFTLLGPGSLKNTVPNIEPSSWKALKKALDDPNKDDTYTSLVFTIAGTTPSPHTPSNAAVTISPAGSGNYYLGETVHVSGANTAGGTITYLFITGPNLPAYGAQIQSLDPRVDPIVDTTAATFGQSPVGGGTWSYTWDTHSLNLDPGTYRIYAENSPRDLAHIGPMDFKSTSITFDDPFVSGTLSHPAINPGDPLSVLGTAEGSPTPGVAIWIFGDNYRSRTTAVVQPDASYNLPVSTTGLAPGEYFVIAQHPMNNDQFDIIPSGNNVRNLKLGAAGTDIFTMLGAGSLKKWATPGAPGVESAVINALHDPYKDDTYTKMSFLVLGSPPTPPTPSDPTAVNVSISGGSTHYLGETIHLSGYNTVSLTTYLFLNRSNLPVNGGQIMSPDPPNTAVIDGDGTTFGQAPVATGTWTYSWNTKTVNLDPGTYKIYVESSARDLPNIGTNNFNSVPVTFETPPYVDATLSPSFVQKGTSVTISGTAEGNPTPGVAIWIMGPNYKAMHTVPVQPDGTFSESISTDGLSNGKYEVIVQHPMFNDQFDIVLSGNNVRNLKLGTGTDIFTFLGVGSLKSEDASVALKGAINDPANDDIYSKLTFEIGVPAPPPPPPPPQYIPPPSDNDDAGPPPAHQENPPALVQQQPPPPPRNEVPLPPDEHPQPEQVAESFPMGFEGLSFNADGQNSLDLDLDRADAAGATVTTYFDHVEVYQHASPGVLITFFGDAFAIKDRKIKGTVKRAEFATDPLIANLTVGPVSGSVHAVLTALTQRVTIDNTINGNVSAGITEQLRSVVAQNNLQMEAVAYTMDVRRVNLAKTGAANVTLTVPPSWVDQHGGKDAVKIARIGEETGVAELLTTSYIGIDSRGNVMFRGDSPNGTSIFGMVSAKATAIKQQEGPGVTIQPITNPAMFTDVGMFSWLAGILLENPILIVIVIILVAVLGYASMRRKK
jgi:hypothetical protein